MSTTNLNTNNFYHPALPLSPHGDTPIFRTSRISSEQGASLQDRTDHFSIGNTKKVRLSIIEQSEDCEDRPRRALLCSLGTTQHQSRTMQPIFLTFFFFGRSTKISIGYHYRLEHDESLTKLATHSKDSKDAIKSLQYHRFTM